MFAAGFQTSTVDWLDDPSQNLLDERYVQTHISLLERGWFSVQLIATECTTFSRGTHPAYRTNIHLKGLPNQTEERMQFTADANRLAYNSARLYKAGVRGAKWTRNRGLHFWENPGESMLWQMDGGCQEIVEANFNCITCFCRFGRPYRKRTRIVSNVNLNGTPVERPCKHGKVKHRVALRGYNAKAKKNWTKVANQYPKPFCRALVNEIVRHFNRR